MRAAREPGALVAAYVGMGAHASTIAALLPAWAARSDDTVLAAVPALFAGLFVGVLASAPLLAAASAGRVLRVSAASQAISLVGLAAAGWTLAPGATRTVVGLAALSGAAFGVTESATSVAARAATGTDRRLGRLLATSAATAAVLPLVVLLARRSGAGEVVLLVGATALAVAALLPVVGHGTAVPDEPAAAVDDDGEPDGGAPDGGAPDSGAADAGPRRAGSRPGARALAGVLAPAAAALALYVGVETLLSGWSAVLVRDLLGTDPSVAALGASAFWLLMAVGRARGARSSSSARPRAAAAGAALAVAAAAGAAPVVVVAACAVAVLAIAPLYPRLLGPVIERLDVRASARWTGPLVAAGAAGGSLLPALALAVGSAAGASTFVVAALACGALVAVAPQRVRTERPGTRRI